MITVDDLDALVRTVVDAGDPLVLETLTVLLRLALDSDPSSADRTELAAAIGESPAATDLRDLLADLPWSTTRIGKRRQDNQPRCHWRPTTPRRSVAPEHTL